MNKRNKKLSLLTSLSTPKPLVGSAPATPLEESSPMRSKLGSQSVDLRPTSAGFFSPDANMFRRKSMDSTMATATTVSESTFTPPQQTTTYQDNSMLTMSAPAQLKVSASNGSPSATVNRKRSGDSSLRRKTSNDDPKAAQTALFDLLCTVMDPITGCTAAATAATKAAQGLHDKLHYKQLHAAQSRSGGLERLFRGFKKSKSCSGAAAFASFGNKIFGVPLESSLAVSSVTRSLVDGTQAQLPACLVHLSEYMCREGGALSTRGIFRVPGSVRRIAELRGALDDPSSVFYTDPVRFMEMPCTSGGKYNIHDAAAVIKLYLRALPDPAITVDVAPWLIAANSLQGEPHRLKALRLGMRMLPVHHRHLCSFLLTFLSRISASAEENGMDASNLSTVFCPNIFRPYGSAENLNHGSGSWSGGVANLVCSNGVRILGDMILYSDRIFGLSVQTKNITINTGSSSYCTGAGTSYDGKSDEDVNVHQQQSSQSSQQSAWTMKQGPKSKDSPSTAMTERKGSIRKETVESLSHESKQGTHHREIKLRSIEVSDQKSLRTNSIKSRKNEQGSDSASVRGDNSPNLTPGGSFGQDTIGKNSIRRSRSGVKSGEGSEPRSGSSSKKSTLRSVRSTNQRSRGTNANSSSNQSASFETLNIPVEMNISANKSGSIQSRRSVRPLSRASSPRKTVASPSQSSPDDLDEPLMMKIKSPNGDGGGGDDHKRGGDSFVRDDSQRRDNLETKESKFSSMVNNSLPNSSRERTLSRSTSVQNDHGQSNNGDGALGRNGGVGKNARSSSLLGHKKVSPSVQNMSGRSIPSIYRSRREGADYTGKAAAPSTLAGGDLVTTTTVVTTTMTTTYVTSSASSSSASSCASVSGSGSTCESVYGSSGSRTSTLNRRGTTRSTAGTHGSHGSPVLDAKKRDVKSHGIAMSSTAQQRQYPSGQPQPAWHHNAHNQQARVSSTVKSSTSISSASRPKKGYRQSVHAIPVSSFSSQVHDWDDQDLALSESMAIQGTPPRDSETARLRIFRVREEMRRARDQLRRCEQRFEEERNRISHVCDALNVREQQLLNMVVQSQRRPGKMAVAQHPGGGMVPAPAPGGKGIMAPSGNGNVAKEGIDREERMKHVMAMAMAPSSGIGSRPNRTRSASTSSLLHTASSSHLQQPYQQHHSVNAPFPMSPLSPLSPLTSSSGAGVSSPSAVPVSKSSKRHEYQRPGMLHSHSDGALAVLRR